MYQIGSGKPVRRNGFTSLLNFAGTKYSAGGSGGLSHINLSAIRLVFERGMTLPGHSEGSVAAMTACTASNNSHYKKK